MPNHPPNDVQVLARSRLNGDDELVIQLVRTRMPAAERTLHPTVVRIIWPPQPSIVDARAYSETAATLTKLFAESAIALAGIKAHGR